MTPLAPVLHSFAYAVDFLSAQLADVADADATLQPGGFTNHPAWTVGHLTFTCELLGGALGLAPWLPADWSSRYGPGSTPVPDPAAYEPLDRALARLADARSRLTRAVERVDPARLDEPFPDPAYADVFPTLRHAVTQVLVGHTAYHVGQIGAWRRAGGRAPLARSFE